MIHDYLVVGSGLYGSIFAYELKKRGKTVIVVEKRNHIGGNCYTYSDGGIHVHKYGPHTFHTSNKMVWDYVNQFTPFTNHTPRVKVKNNNKVFSFPINMMTFHQLWGVETPEQAKAEVEKRKYDFPKPKNLEEYILSQVGSDIYEIFFKYYTKKQWGRDPVNLPSSIIKRIPIRYSYDDTYHHNAMYQGTPLNGYTEIFNKMLDGIDVELDCDFEDLRSNWKLLANKLVFSGCIDAFFEYQHGRLDYRSIRHETQRLEKTFQGASQINYTDEATPFTRILEWKYFQYNSDFDHSVITTEYPQDYTGEAEPFYPICDEANLQMYSKYRRQASDMKDVIIGGRLGNYKYMDMDMVVAKALKDVKKELGDC